MVARAIRQSSLRRQRRFVALNCGAIPESLLEAELFGRDKGAYTGAIGHRLGRIEQADRGTLFLDEVGNMPSSLQMKLLRVLQDASSSASAISAGQGGRAGDRGHQRRLADAPRSNLPRISTA